MNKYLGIKVVIFSGGRGASEIINAFSARPDIDLTILINGYDDGKSTGVIRALFPTLLGPSDFRKVISNILRNSGESELNTASLFEYRLSKDDIYGEKGIVENLSRGFSFNSTNVDQLIGNYLEGIRRDIGDYVSSLFNLGLVSLFKNPKFSVSDLLDMSLGNIILLGIWIDSDYDFNAAINNFTKQLRIKANILNINDGSSLYLMALKQNGDILWNESEIVSKQVASAIEDLFLLDTDARQEINSALGLESVELKSALSACSIRPVANIDAIKSIENADIIIYGPGTQNSSLFPSYMTQGVGDTIQGNTKASKFFIVNIDEDLDIQGENFVSIIDHFAYFMNRNSDNQLEVSDLVDYALINSGRDLKDSWILNGFQKDKFAPSIALGSWADSSRKHSGERVMRSILSLTFQQNGSENRVDFDSVSIVIPVLNEIRTIRQVFEEILIFDWLNLGIVIEIIVVDGGSADGSLEYLRKLPNIKLIELELGAGRGDALSLGLKLATGSYVITFPADKEYALNGLIRCISMLRDSEVSIVFGSRAPFCIDSDERLKKIYEGKRREYLQSKWGGILISFLLAVLHKRWISDPLTSIKGFKREILGKLSLSQPGIDWDTQIVMDARTSGLTIVEVPVDYTPRNRAQGKKTKTRDGIPLVSKLIFGRVSKPRRQQS